MRRTTTAIVGGIVGALVAIPIVVYATHSFTDVPGTHTFHNDIAWLADAEVTRGCNPPANTRYCPDDLVTRGQMAAFMRRLAENQVVDAGTVAGLHASEITTVSGTYGAPAGQLTVPYQVSTKIEEITISAPTDGFLFLQANASYRFGTVKMIQWLQLNDTACEGTEENVTSVDFSYGSLLDGDGDRQTIANGAVVPVEHGDHTITLCVRTSNGPANPQLDGSSLQAMFFVSGKVEPPLHP